MNVQQIREALGLDKASFADRIWPTKAKDWEERALRVRTIRRWEDEGVKPHILFQVRLDELAKEAEHRPAGEGRTNGNGRAPEEKSGPRRRPLTAKPTPRSSPATDESHDDGDDDPIGGLLPV